MKKVHKVIIDPDYGICLPTGNTEPTHEVIDKKEYDKAVKALNDVWQHTNTATGREIIKKALTDLGEI